jgi:molecular chaperone DnaK
MDQPSSTESNALTLRIKFKSPTLDEFINRYGVDVSPGGIFIRTRQPVEVGTSLQFDFALADGSSLLAGLGTVAWVRENDPSRANNVPGMGLRFDKLTPDSQHVHQTILAEKARKEGKGHTTPYPPTAFVAPAGRQSPAAEPVTAAHDAPVLPPEALPNKAEPAPANFAKTLPAPAAAMAARMHESANGDEFESGGKTEISDKPIDYYMREAEAMQRAAAAGGLAPSEPLENWKTDSHALEGEAAPPAPDEVSISDSQSYATEAPPAPANLTASGERRISSKQAFAELLDLGDTSENLSGAQSADAGSGVPIELTTSDKTEEVSLVSGKTAEEPLEPIDLGTAMSEEEVEEVPSLAEVEAATVAPKSRRGTVIALGAVVLAGAAAFAAVYLLQAKPWQGLGTPEAPTIVVKKGPAVAPIATPEPAPAAQPAPTAKPVAAAGEKAAVPTPEKPAAEEPKPAAAAAAKPAAEEAKPVAKAPLPEQVAAEEPAAEAPAPDKPTAEKAALAKAEAPAAKGTPKPAGKATTKPSAEPAPAEKPAAGAAEQEEIFRLSFKSVPIGAEVLIDGEYYARTPCERRILDPKKSMSITVRKEGYEPHERMVGSSENWVQKGNERILTISVTLKKAEKSAATPAPAPVAAPKPAAPAAAGPETKPAAKPGEEEPFKE